MPSSACIMRRPPTSTPFPYTTLFRSSQFSRINRPAFQSLLARSLPCWTLASEKRTSWVEDIASRPKRNASAPWTSISSSGSIPVPRLDRKSTRLNSSHLGISYAVFCLHHAATTDIYTLSLHDALPIFAVQQDQSPRVPELVGEIAPLLDLGVGEADVLGRGHRQQTEAQRVGPVDVDFLERIDPGAEARSEEHTSELQSLRHLVCRLLLASCGDHRHLHPFPTRRSSDLRSSAGSIAPRSRACWRDRSPAGPWRRRSGRPGSRTSPADRSATRRPRGRRFPRADRSRCRG